jgi:hypothetical protein
MTVKEGCRGRVVRIEDQLDPFITRLVAYGRRGRAANDERRNEGSGPRRPER